MDAQQALTLGQTLPDAFLAILKRMPSPERKMVLKEFEERFPKAYAAWLTADTEAYLRFIEKL